MRHWLRNQRWVHFVNWFKHQTTVKVKDQDVAGTRVKPKGGIKSQLVARVQESMPRAIKLDKLSGLQMD